DECGQHSEYRYRTGIIDFHFLFPDFFLQKKENENAGDDSSRKIDQENPTPIEEFSQSASQYWSQNSRDSPDTGQPALDSCSFLDRVNIPGDSADRSHDRSGTHTLDPSENDERIDIPGCC